MVGSKIGYVLGLLVHGKVVVEFGRKVFLVDSLLCKALNMAKISTTEQHENSACNHSRKHTCGEVST